MPYVARQVLAETIEPDVLELWRRTRQNQSELESTFRWYYRSGAGRDNRCFVVEHAGQAESRVVGATGLGMRAFRIGERHVNAGLLGDFFVHTAHRSLFPALSLQRAAFESAQLTSAFVYGFPNAKALPVFRRLGFAELGTMARFVRVLDYAPYLERGLGKPWLTGGVAPVLNGLARLGQVRALPSAVACRTAWESHFDERFDALDRSSRLDVRFRGERSASFLNWRFVAKPGSAARIFTLCARRSGLLRAYAVVEVEKDVAHLRDAFGTDWPAVANLLVRLEPELRELRARSITCNALDASPLSSLLVRIGYIARESTRKVIARAAAEDAAQVAGPDGWHLTDADEDQ
jgi:hypothetical protein